MGDLWIIWLSGHRAESAASAHGMDSKFNSVELEISESALRKTDAELCQVGVRPTIKDSTKRGLPPREHRGTETSNLY
ncbi:uncharacterized protein BDV17DRAFT_53741 [Aspergillus undulatus]|uniref:uncharacterized protein n=1 Tax=Aspergillus undulatus TaxID=1810928 RepID=UPI003CCDC0E9